MSGDDRLKDHPEWVIERQGKKMVLYQGLLHLAHLDGLTNITTTVVQCPSDLNGQTCIVSATVQTSKGVFSGLGDTTPKNVGRMVADHAIRMAETRAKARALRDALDIGYVAAEELGDDAPAAAPKATQGGDWPRDGQGATHPAQTAPTAPTGAQNGPPAEGVRRGPCKRCGETVEAVVENGQRHVFNVGADGQRSRVLHASTCVAAQAEPGR